MKVYDGKIKQIICFFKVLVKIMYFCIDKNENPWKKKRRN